MRSPIWELWIGYQRDNDNWVNTDAQPMSYNHWFTGEPNNYGGSENCVSIKDLGNTNPFWEENGIEPEDGGLPFYPGWNDIGCGAQLQYICQKLVNSMTTTTTTTTTTTSGKSIIIYY